MNEQLQDLEEKVDPPYCSASSQFERLKKLNLSQSTGVFCYAEP